MATYNRTRELLASKQWNVNHPDRYDQFGVRLTLIEELDAAIPGAISGLVCAGDQLTVRTSRDLTAIEQTKMDQVIANHKANASLGSALLDAKAAKAAAIRNRTGDLCCGAKWNEEGDPLLAQVAAAATVTEVNNVIDNR